MKKLLLSFTYIGFCFAVASSLLLTFVIIDVTLLTSLADLFLEAGKSFMIYIPPVISLLFVIFLLFFGGKKDPTSTLMNIITALLLGASAFFTLIIHLGNGFNPGGVTTHESLESARFLELLYFIAAGIAFVGLLGATILFPIYKKEEPKLVTEEDDLDIFAADFKPVTVESKEKETDNSVEVKANESKEEEVTMPKETKTTKTTTANSKTQEEKKTKPTTTKAETPKAEATKPVKKKEKTTGAKEPRRVYHLNKREEDNKWTIVFTGSKRVLKLCDTQKEAIAYVEELCAKNGGTYLVHNSKGKNKGRIKAK